ncbi:GNAT family N-acetyltransferase [Chitinophaga defluvii]|uniref:GNAT family N-acetyltransferase n=1 Tax=Chitinophaga defluvii TaxID=3163343 RepID=A0ABV2T220_9BACT
MEIFAATPRLILREIIPADEKGMFTLDADPEVHKYLGNQPVTSMEEVRSVIQFIRRQYVDNGIGRWAVIEKDTNLFLGWAGLKLITTPIHNRVNYYDLGYRLIKSCWGKGYATEAARAVRDYGFNRMGLPVIYGMTEVGNTGSRRVLEKTGLKYIESFEYEGLPHDFFGMTRPE